ncbi:cell envelope integrity protein TolA [Leptotrichia sp. oral taxon 879]|uniref:cell envelope integrity protein TolA n=1 Tax=Leptotrichia sp. oral taxon 879 TaxID=1227267 RepID=UPI0003ADC2A5|nr:SPOR domain-containing protein [Leptotrichia sp. oral taxon 879]ERK55112.1 sporulation and cell division repeat protein [Leptotrichia sp. oral taxon 879 str. F0557]
MSFRLNPFKVMRAVGIVAVVTYGIVLATGYKKSKETTTESVTKEMKIRNKDFYNSKDYKNNLTLPNQVVENNNETVTKELEQAKSSQPINLQQDQIAINPKNVSSQSQTNVKITNDAKKKQEETKLEVKKLEQKKQEEAKIAEQKRQEEARIEARQAEIRKQQQEAARKEQARVEAAKQHAKEEAARKAREEAKKNQIKSGSKKYIQVASVTSESSAREIAKKLGGNFYYKKTSVNGRTVYVVMSNMTDNPNTLKTMENQAKKAGSGYMIRSVGK